MTHGEPSELLDKSPWFHNPYNHSVARKYRSPSWLQDESPKFQDPDSGSLGEALVACTRARDDHTGVMEAYPEDVRALHGEVS
jgi:hypothetical protein